MNQNDWNSYVSSGIEADTALDVLDSTDNYVAESKAAQLQEKSKEKVNRLSGLTGQAFNQKLQEIAKQDMNTLPAEELQYALGYSMSNPILADEQGRAYKVKEDEYGNFIEDASGQNVLEYLPENTDTYDKRGRNVYIDDTKDGAYKLGLAAMEKGFDGRYTPDWKQYVPFLRGYGWSPGEKGVTPEDGALMDTTVDYDLATALEKVVHSNMGQIRNRAIGEGPVSEMDKVQYGSGKTEYTTQNAPMWNIDYIDSGEQLAEGTPLPDGVVYNPNIDQTEVNPFAEYDKKLRKRAGYKDKQSAWDEAKQTVAGAVAGAGKGAVELVDALQEFATWGILSAYNAATGENIDIDLIDDDKKKAAIQAIDDAVGYDRAYDERDLARLTKMAEEVDFDITDTDSWKRFADTFGWEAVTMLAKNPSLTAGFVTEIVGAGGVLGAGTKVTAKVGSKLAPKLAEKVGNLTTLNRTTTTNAMKQLDEIKATTGMTDDIYKAAQAKIKAEYTIGKKVADYLKGTSMTNADMAIRVNNDLDEYEKNNDGQPADAWKTLQIVGINRLLSNAEIGALKIEAGIGKEAKQILKNKIADAVLQASGHLAKSIGTEAIQETMDSIGEQINQKLDSKDYEGKTVGEVLKDASAEILTGTLAGAAGGFHVGGAVAAGQVAGVTVGPGVQALGEKWDDYSGNLQKENMTKPSVSKQGRRVTFESIGSAGFELEDTPEARKAASEDITGRVADLYGDYKAMREEAPEYKGANYNRLYEEGLEKFQKVNKIESKLGKEVSEFTYAKQVLAKMKAMKDGEEKTSMLKTFKEAFKDKEALKNAEFELEKEQLNVLFNTMKERLVEEGVIQKDEDLQTKGTMTEAELKDMNALLDNMKGLGSEAASTYADQVRKVIGKRQKLLGSETVVPPEELKKSMAQVNAEVNDFGFSIGGNSYKSISGHMNDVNEYVNKYGDVPVDELNELPEAKQKMVSVVDELGRFASYRGKRQINPIYKGKDGKLSLRSPKQLIDKADGFIRNTLEEDKNLLKVLKNVRVTDQNIELIGNKIDDSIKKVEKSIADKEKMIELREQATPDAIREMYKLMGLDVDKHANLVAREIKFDVKQKGRYTVEEDIDTTYEYMPTDEEFASLSDTPPTETTLADELEKMKQEQLHKAEKAEEKRIERSGKLDAWIMAVNSEEKYKALEKRLQSYAESEDQETAELGVDKLRALKEYQSKYAPKEVRPEDSKLAAKIEMDKLAALVQKLKDGEVEYAEVAKAIQESPFNDNNKKTMISKIEQYKPKPVPTIEENKQKKDYGEYEDLRKTIEEEKRWFNEWAKTPVDKEVLKVPITEELELDRSKYAQLQQDLRWNRGSYEYMETVDGLDPEVKEQIRKHTFKTFGEIHGMIIPEEQDRPSRTVAKMALAYLNYVITGKSRIKDLDVYEEAYYMASDYLATDNSGYASAVEQIEDRKIKATQTEIDFEEQVDIQEEPAVQTAEVEVQEETYVPTEKPSNVRIKAYIRDMIGTDKGKEKMFVSAASVATGLEMKSIEDVNNLIEMAETRATEDVLLSAIASMRGSELEYIKALRDDSDKLQEVHIAEREKVEAIGRYVDNLQESIDSYTDELDILKDKRKEVQAAIWKHRNDVGRLGNKVNMLVSNIVHLKQYQKAIDTKGEVKVGDVVSTKKAMLGDVVYTKKTTLGKSGLAAIKELYDKVRKGLESIFPALKRLTERGERLKKLMNMRAEQLNQKEVELESINKRIEELYATKKYVTEDLVKPVVEQKAGATKAKDKTKQKLDTIRREIVKFTGREKIEDELFGLVKENKSTKQSAGSIVTKLKALVNYNKDDC